MGTDAVHTMQDFARRIGLSRPTVSRFFADPDSVRPRTRKLIEEGIRHYGYSPNFFASNLTRGSPRAIGIIVPSIIDPFYGELVSTIELYAEDRGYLTVLQCSHNDSALERRALLRLLSMDVAGIAMAPLGFRSDTAAVEQAMKQVPILFMDSRLRDGVPYVGTNNRTSMALMVDYLCRSGSPPALFTMPAVNANIRERCEAYCDRMRELGHEPRILNPEDGPVGDDYERYGFERFLSLPSERLAGVDTIVCSNDRIAFGVLAAAKRLGLSVGAGPGNDLRIGSYDGQRFGAFASPSLTTSAQNIRGIGELAAKTLIDLENGGELPQEDILLDGTLIFRDSA
jgi:DNA-binding LacI/PurR family transcriptional regulator